MRALGVDPGSRRIGLALSDEGRALASPLTTVTVAGRAAAVRQVAAVAREAGVGQVVVGLPLRTDGSEGPEAGRARAFGEALGEALGLRVVYWDERFTTVVAHRTLREAGRRASRRRSLVDQAAAAVILQSYLDARVEEPCEASTNQRRGEGPREGAPGAGGASGVSSAR